MSVGTVGGWRSTHKYRRQHVQVQKVCIEDGVGFVLRECPCNGHGKSKAPVAVHGNHGGPRQPWPSTTAIAVHGNHGRPRQPWPSTATMAVNGKTRAHPGS